MPASVIAGDRDRGHPRAAPAAARASTAFARPKSSTFTVPSGRTLMFAGFRSRWTMPCCVRGLERLGDLARDRAALRRSAAGRRRDAIGERRPVDELEHERGRAVGFLEPVNAADVRVVERRQHLRFAAETGERARRRGRTDAAGPSARRRDRASCRARDRPAPSRRRR